MDIFQWAIASAYACAAPTVSTDIKVCSGPPNKQAYAAEVSISVLLLTGVIAICSQEKT